MSRCMRTELSPCLFNNCPHGCHVTALSCDRPPVRACSSSDVQQRQQSSDKAVYSLMHKLVSIATVFDNSPVLGFMVTQCTPHPH